MWVVVFYVSNVFSEPCLEISVSLADIRFVERFTGDFVYATFFKIMGGFIVYCSSQLGDCVTAPECYFCVGLFK
jgi:hypothetical protein